MKIISNPSKRSKKYTKILKKNKNGIEYYESADYLLKKYNEHNNTFYQTSILVTAPVLITYVIWVLRKAEEKNLKHLYFLARDGQIMYRISKILCSKFQIEIQCHYLYCSRLSLRIPLYCVDKNEALDKLCSIGAETSTDIILSRMGLSQTEKQIILNDIKEGIQINKGNLTQQELTDLNLKLKQSKVFDRIATQHAKEAYTNLIRYLEQEGLFNEEKFAIVDSGWGGTMQRTLRILLQSKKTDIFIEGFYFGLFSKQCPEDGQYNSFYFRDNKPLKNRVLFNNNVFECLCAADHGMTLSYQEENERIVPVLKTHTVSEYVTKQQEVILEFAKSLKLDYKSATIKSFRKNIRKLLFHFMANPSREEIEVFGEIAFCDDVTENNFFKLAAEFNHKDYMLQVLPFRIFCRLFCKKVLMQETQSFWLWGSIAKMNRTFKWFFQINVYLREILTKIK